MTTTAVHVPVLGGLNLIAERVKGLIARNKSVLIVATRHPASAIFERFKEKGVDITRVFVVDAVQSGMNLNMDDPNHVHQVSAPTLLELIAKRTERIIRTKAQGPPHVIVYDCDTFALHNPTNALIEVVRYVVQNLADAKLPMDFVIQEPSTMPKALQEFLDEFLDKKEHLAPAPKA